MSYCDLYPTFFVDHTRKARKEHICCECETPIRKGETYRVFSGKWDGEIRTHKQHPDCEKLCTEIRDSTPYGDCIAFGEAENHIAECGFESFDPEIQKLIVKFQWKRIRYLYNQKKLERKS